MMLELADRGVAATAVSRDYPEVQIVLEWHGIEAAMFGGFGGADPYSKTIHALERTRKLMDHFAAVEPSALVCLNAPDSCRAAYALAIPIACFCDIPEAQHTSRLSLPLASLVLSPSILDPQSILRFGVDADRLQRYDSLDPLIWLERESIATECGRELGFDPERPVIVCRETEWQSSYVREDIVADAARCLQERHPDWQVYTVPRYDPHPFLHIPSLLSCADLLIGGGGTMCIEAAYLGVPVLATRGLRSGYMEWLFERELAAACPDLEVVVERAEAMVVETEAAARQTRRSRAREVFDSLPFPLEAVVDGILSAASAR